MTVYFFIPIQYKTCYFAFTFQHLADTITTMKRQQKVKYKLNSKAVQFTPTFYSHISKSTQTQLQKTKHKSVNIVAWQESIEM